MNVDEKLVAVIGPNEAGKTSFLNALLHLNTGRSSFVTAGGSRELTRGIEIPPAQKVVQALFLLDDADKESIRHLDRTGKVRWFNIQVGADDNFYAEATQHPERDLQERKVAVQALREVLLRDSVPQSSSGEEDANDDAGDIEEILSLLDVESTNLSEETLDKVRSFAERLQSEEISATSEHARSLGQQLHDLVTYEDKDLHQETINILFRRRPQFLLFSDAERLLQSTYNLDESEDTFPRALWNLARVASLDVPTLRRAIAEEDQGQVETLIERANSKLSRVLLETWSQAGITVRLRVDGSVLHILVGSSGASYVSIAERSDGLRQFVALLAFTTLERTEQPPILLIDEAEAHLHYDAQADLLISA